MMHLKPLLRLWVLAKQAAERCWMHNSGWEETENNGFQFLLLEDHLSPSVGLWTQISKAITTGWRKLCKGSREQDADCWRAVDYMCLICIFHPKVTTIWALGKSSLVTKEEDIKPWDTGDNPFPIRMVPEVTIWTPSDSGCHPMSASFYWSPRVNGTYCHIIQLYGEGQRKHKWLFHESTIHLGLEKLLFSSTMSHILVWHSWLSNINRRTTFWGFISRLSLLTES